MCQFWVKGFSCQSKSLHVFSLIEQLATVQMVAASCNGTTALMNMYHEQEINLC